MKKILIISFLFIICFISNAQNSAISIGGNYNADISSHKLGKINYPSWELSYEFALSKKFSLSGAFNYAKRKYNWYSDFHLPGSSFYFGPIGYINSDKSLIVSARYYLKSFKSGIYFELGIPFTYTTEAVILTSGISLQNTRYEYFYSISTIGGLGINYPITKALGLELNMNISPSLNFLDVDYGTSGFIKSGVKLFWNI